GFGRGQPCRLAAAMQPALLTGYPDLQDRVIGSLGSATMLARARESPRFPLCNRDTVTNAVVIGLLAFYNRDTRFRCHGLKNVRSAHFIGFVTVVTVVSPLSGQIACEGVGELAQPIPSKPFLTLANDLRRYAKRFEKAGQLVLGDRLAGPSVFSPGAAFYRGESCN